MLPDLVWFNGGRAANEDQPNGHLVGAEVVHIVGTGDVLEELPHGAPPRPPPPPADAAEEDDYRCTCGAALLLDHELSAFVCPGCRRYPEKCRCPRGTP